MSDWRKEKIGRYYLAFKSMCLFMREQYKKQTFVIFKITFERQKQNIRTILNAFELKRLSF